MSDKTLLIALSHANVTVNLGPSQSMTDLALLDSLVDVGSVAHAS